MSTLSVDKKWLGLISYDEALQFQESTVQKKEPVVFGLEHKPVVTLGLRAKREKSFIDYNKLNAKNYEIKQTNRGGLVTLHNPGQLVIYPVLPLREFKLGVRDYVCRLLKTTQKTLADCGVNSMVESAENPGVYTKNGKIAFVGIKVQSGCSMHGVSINLNNDLEDFSAINSCGISNLKLDSVQQILAKSIKSEEFFNSWFDHFVGI